MKLDLGQTVDRYVIERVLGAGGTAMVYLVRHNNLGTLHALKVLTLSGSSIRERMEREGRVQASLQHPNVVAVTAQIDVEGSLGLLMEYVDGPSLESALQRYALAIGDAETLFSGILAGVRAAHREGLVHRDLKPANVLLARSPEGFIPKVTDFGLAKILEQDPAVAQTRAGIAMGTPSYMAPEQIRDARSVDQRADLWSLGCILYELLTRTRAFPGDEALAIYNAVVDGDYLPPRTHVPELPERLHQAIVGCLQVDLNSRIPDCEALAAVMAGDLPWECELPLPRTLVTPMTDEAVTADFVRNSSQAITARLPDMNRPQVRMRSTGARGAGGQGGALLPDLRADAPTMSVAKRTATPPPAPPRAPEARGPDGGLVPVGMGGAFPASFGNYEADYAETVITSTRALDGTLSPLDSLDHPTRAGLLGFLGGSLLAVGLLGLAVGLVLVLIVLLLGSLVLSSSDLDPNTPAQTIPAPAPVPLVLGPDPAPSPAPSPKVSPKPAPAKPAPAQHPKPAPDAAPTHGGSTSPAPAPQESPAPEPAPNETANPEGTYRVMLRTDPIVADVEVGGVRRKTPIKYDLKPGTYVVKAWSGGVPDEFVITVREDAANEYCYSFRDKQLVMGPCQPHQ